jgi:hypothetical protein
VEVVAKKEVAGDQQKIEESPSSAEGCGELPLRAGTFRSVSLSPAAGSRFFLERERTERAAGSSFGGSGGNTSKIEVERKREKADDPHNTEESPPGAEGDAGLPLRAES